MSVGGTDSGRGLHTVIDKGRIFHADMVNHDLKALKERWKIWGEAQGGRTRPREVIGSADAFE